MMVCGRAVVCLFVERETHTGKRLREGEGHKREKRKGLHKEEGDETELKKQQSNIKADPDTSILVSARRLYTFLLSFGCNCLWISSIHLMHTLT
jgi:hypothetical protein